MEYAYYYSPNSIVLLTKEDARMYFFNEDIFSEFGYEYLNEFLSDESYSRADLLMMSTSEKEDVLEEYRDWCFEEWFEEELVRVCIYND